MQIQGFQKTTLLDYPGHLAATIFLGGCNFRCPFCHNASLVLAPQSISPYPEEEVFSVLEKRKRILEGVCITGGEPTLYPSLPALIKRIKALGLDVKLDTNGTNPSMLSSLIRQGLLDYAAMDIKNSPEKYPETMGFGKGDPNAAALLSLVRASAGILMASDIPFEFRTTAVKEYHEADDFEAIGKWLRGAPSYYIQSFEDSGDVIGDGLSPWDKDTLLSFVRRIRPYIPAAALRGID